MTFQELDACIAVSGRRSIASALIAFILDALGKLRLSGQQIPI